jgi:ribosomal protein S21
MINVEVIKNRNENSVNLIRRFSRKVKGSGTIQAVRSRRYRNRPLSSFKQKQDKLKKLERKEKYERLKKLGKIPQ